MIIYCRTQVHSIGLSFLASRERVKLLLPLHELCIGSFLHDAPFAHHQYPVGHLHRRQPMGCVDSTPAAHLFVQPLKHFGFGLCIKG